MQSKKVEHTHTCFKYSCSFHHALLRHLDWKCIQKVKQFVSKTVCHAFKCDLSCNGANKCVCWYSQKMAKHSNKSYIYHHYSVCENDDRFSFVLSLECLLNVEKVVAILVKLFMTTSLHYKIDHFTCVDLWY